MNNPVTVTVLDDERMIREGETAVDLYNKDIKNARTRIMPMARGLLAARRKYPANQDFGDWLQISSYREIEKDERAALIKIGEHDDFAAKYVRTTSLISPRTIWDAIEELMPTSHDANSTNIVEPTLTLPNPEPIPDIPAIPAPEPSAVLDSAPLPRIPRRSFMYGWPRAAEVYAAFNTSQTRSNIGAAIADRGGKDIWALILLAIDHGFLTKTDMTAGKITARILFPASPRAWWTKYDLTDAKKRAHVRDIVMPAAIANRDAILAAPERIEEILAAHAHNTRKVVTERKLTETLRQMPAEQQHEITVFGERLWPCPPTSAYDYDQLRAAIWYFRDINNWLESSHVGRSIGSRALTIRHSTRWPWEYANRALGTDRAKMQKVYQLIDHITHLLETNPDGECKWPPTPTSEGQW